MMISTGVWAAADPQRMRILAAAKEQLARDEAPLHSTHAQRHTAHTGF